MQYAARSLALALVLVGLGSLPLPAGAQVGDRLKRAKEKIEQKTSERPVREQPQPAAQSPAESSGNETAADANAKPGEAAWVNYDFVPGSRPLFVDDFSRDNVGDFPRRLEFIEGNMEVADFRGARWLRGTTRGKFAIVLPERLPEQFTLEFDHIGKSSTWPHITIFFGGDAENPDKLDVVQAWTWDGNERTSSGGVFDASGNRRSVGSTAAPVQEVAFPVRVMADGKYVKVYMAGTRVANIPNANLGRSNKIVVFFDANTDRPAYFGNFRIAAGGKKLYDALAAEGRVATQGIYFDTGSDRIRPESTPTLKEIGEMLKEHPELKLTIEGHTDNVGQAAANQTLSEKRAAAVKQHLVANYGIDGARLQTQGFGASKPAGSNDTPEGRQTNRRVELVKM